MSELLHVLLIEDNPDDAVLLQDALENGGLSVEVTRIQTETELRNALARRWDVVISDFRLPRFDGLAALRIVRAADADVPFILVSGAIGEEVAVEVMRAGAGDFVLKDHLLRLAPAVRRELQEAENRRERRRAEQALRESEERFRSVLESSLDAAYRRDLRTDSYDYMSPVIERLTGFTAEEFSRMPLTEVMERTHPDDCTRVDAELDRIMTSPSGTGMIEYRLQKKDGGYIWLADHLTIIRDIEGHPLYRVGIVRDVTGQKVDQAERERLLAEVQHRAAELTATFESIADGLIIYDRDGKLLYMNAAAERILRYTPEECALSLEARMHEIRMSDANDIPLPYEKTPPYRAIHGDTVRGEVVVIHRHDHAFWLSLSAAPILLPDGTRAGSVLTFTDITPLHELQDRERRYLYTLAHNLRAPATLINGNLELLLEMLQSGGQVESYGHLIDALRHGLYRMNTMIDDFYLVTRLEEGDLGLHPTRVALEPYLHELLQRYEHILDTARIHLDLPPDLPPVWADPERLETILINLLHNALKFSAPETPVRVDARRQHEEVAISVTDQGIGIAAEDLPHVFDRFYRVEQIRKAEGTGLGLYITRRLVEAHAMPAEGGQTSIGGRIRAESTLGKGSTFTFTLPIAIPS